MKFEASELQSEKSLDCDVVVIGSGAAGIPCACELIKSGKRVILLESGGLEKDAQTQSLAEGEVVDSNRHGALGQYRKRIFGGTTTVWGGRCAPFDALDFEKRDHVPNSGWPIGRKDLEPYYQAAHRYLFTGEFDYNASTAMSDGERPVIEGLGDEIWLQDQLWRFSLPANLGAEFREQLSQAPNVRVLLNANVLNLNTSEDGESIQSVDVGCLNGNRFKVTAKTVILAAGGLESVRLMLLSKGVHQSGIGNCHDLLGRYYGSHVSGDFGEVRFKPGQSNVLWEYQQTQDGVYAKRQLRIREEIQRKEGLLNLRCILTHPPFADASHGNGVLSAAYLAKRFLKGQIPPEYSKELSESGYHSLPKHTRNVILGSFGLGTFGLHWLKSRILARRKYPSISLKSRENSYTIHFDSEQMPNRESRVMLGEKLDAFGLPQLKVDWKYSSLDVDSVVRSCELLRSSLERDEVGTFKQSAEESKEMILRGFGVGSHHIGATRMSSSPREGVVDSNCQVHGVKGLYVASPSVFPTGGFANPVLTTVAIALRVADHIQSNDLS
jgi:choline dehydrogenase-like flavoprotein